MGTEEEKKGNEEIVNVDETRSENKENTQMETEDTNEEIRNGETDSKWKTGKNKIHDPNRFKTSIFCYLYQSS